MNINTSQAGAVSSKRKASGYSNLYLKNSYVNDYVRQRNQQKKSYNKYRSSSAADEEESVSSLRELMYEKRKKDKNDDFYSRFTQNSYNYAESLRASRAKNQKTKTKVKKLRYSFKAISSQIMKSKTSVTARQVAGKAKREVVRLRQKKLSAQYDPEEVQIALTHALKIERVAKKKVKHLLEEEKVKVTGGPCAGELEENSEPSDKEKAEEAIAAMENGMSGEDAAAMQQRRAMSSQEQAQYIQEQMQAMQEMMQAQMEQMQYAMEMAQEQMQASMEDMMTDFMEEMEESMKELLEESGLSELLEEMAGGFDMEMDPADYHMMKLKHRAKELKEIAEADAEYLKAVFDRLERMKDSAMQGFSGNSDNNTASFAGVPSGGGVVAAVNTESAAEIVHDSADLGGAADTGTFSSVGVSVGSPTPMVGVSVDVSI